MSEVLMLGLCGASGVGKSTIALNLRGKHPDHVGVVHFDDFQKSNEQIEAELGTIDNWDDPAVTDFDDAYQKLRALKSGQLVTVQVKNEFDNPGFIRNIFVRFGKTIEPKPLMIVEGHYTLFDQRIRNLFDIAVFLDGDIAVSTNRRTKGTDDVYNQANLLPAYREHILPTGSTADHIINVDGFAQEEVAQTIGGILLAHGVRL